MSRNEKRLLSVLIVCLILAFSWIIGGYVENGTSFFSIDKEIWEVIYEGYKNVPALPF